MTYLLQSGSICLVAFVFVSTAAADNDKRDVVVSESTTELSVPPLDHVEYPTDRPAWLNDAPDFDSKTNTWVVVTSPCETYEACEEELAILLRAAVSSYIRQLTGSEQVDFYPVNDEWIESLVADDYGGGVTKGDSPMVEQAAKLEFSPDQQEKILVAWKNIQVRERLGGLGVLVFLGLTFLIGSSSILGVVTRRGERKSQTVAA